MLTGFQVSEACRLSEHGSLLCDKCASDEYTRPLSHYELDEHQAELSASEYFEGDGIDHAEYCGCLVSVGCEHCGTELAEAFEDSECLPEDDD